MHDTPKPAITGLWIPLVLRFDEPEVGAVLFAGVERQDDSRQVSTPSFWVCHRKVYLPFVLLVSSAPPGMLAVIGAAFGVRRGGSSLGTWNVWQSTRRENCEFDASLGAVLTDGGRRDGPPTTSALGHRRSDVTRDLGLNVRLGKG